MNSTDQLVEKIKSYWNRQPCNIRHGRSEFGTPDFYKEVSDRRYKVEPHIREFAGFHLWRGKRVLEIGSGIGSDAEEFAKHGADYVGIDISQESVDIATQRFEVLGLPGVFHCRDASQSFADLGEFDLVYSYGVIHHYPDLNGILRNVAEVMTADSEFRFMVYARNSWKYAMIQKGLDQFEAQTGCPYAKAFTKEEIPEILDGIFKVERLRQDHCFMYNVESYKAGEYKLESWFEAMNDDVRQAVREYLGWHLLVKAKKI
jgi:2-polyprenyl-3-methyl-5-hydroxy-6-metoxy-1,4-benzoquinol methylase